jgi:hypothetical protein
MIASHCSFLLSTGTGTTTLLQQTLLDSPNGDHHNPNHQSQSHHGEQQQQQQSVNLPTPEMSPLENSDKEGQLSDEARGVKLTSPVMQLMNFANKPFPPRTPPFAPFHTSARNGVQVINNHQNLQNHYHQQMQSQHHHIASQLQQQQQQQHASEQYTQQQHHHHPHAHSGRQMEFYDPMSSPGLYNSSPQYGGEQHHYANWLAQQESEELLQRGGYHLDHAPPPGSNNYYDYVPSPGYHGMDANHNSFYGYGMKIEPQDSLLTSSSPYNDHHNSPGSTTGSSSATVSSNGGGSGGVGHDYESSSLIYKALSEACNGTN